MTLTPDPNGAKKFNIAHRTSKPDASPERRRAGLRLAKKICFFFREGNQEEPVFDPLAERALEDECGRRGEVGDHDRSPW